MLFGQSKRFEKGTKMINRLSEASNSLSQAKFSLGLVPEKLRWETPSKGMTRLTRDGRRPLAHGDKRKEVRE